jgi:hypothetical protein
MSVYKYKIKSDFIICVCNKDYPVSLIKGKVYKKISDEMLDKNKLIKIIDESGKSYLYSESLFLPIKLNKNIIEKIL